MMKKTAQLGFFLATALILSYIEHLIPFSLGIPGIKLGLPNLIVVLLLYRRGAKEALTVNMLRIVLSGFLFSGLYTILYALAGAVFSFAAMLSGKRLSCFSIVGVSILGGVFHNVGQIIAAIFVVETFSVAFYLPFLLFAGTVTGALIGIAGQSLLPYFSTHDDRLF